MKCIWSLKSAPAWWLGYESFFRALWCVTIDSGREHTLCVCPTHQNSNRNFKFMTGSVTNNGLVMVNQSHSFRMRVLLIFYSLPLLLQIPNTNISQARHSLCSGASSTLQQNYSFLCQDAVQGFRLGATAIPLQEHRKIIMKLLSKIVEKGFWLIKQ